MVLDCDGKWFCRHCDYACNDYQTEHMRSHHNRRHLTDHGKFSVKMYRSARENNKKDPVVRKRIYRAKKRGFSNVIPRQCQFVRGGNTCKIFVQSAERLSTSVRCEHHKLKCKKFADKHGGYKSPLSYLELLPSNIFGAGNGVCTTFLAVFQPGDLVTKFEGTFMTKLQVENGAHRRNYTVNCRALGGTFLSGINKPFIRGGLGSFVNGSHHATHRPNVEFSFHKEPSPSVYLRAVSYIGPNTELYVSYGSGFHHSL